ncbi:MAG: hypothetical protein K9M96_18755 [Deltaproteobacteria bacterium]|nr:hypothetical protein [Deltaproteobacteria bacterium]MCF8118907.1 hypothetical protein [Deltaproteobacteria bacterium]
MDFVEKAKTRLDHWMAHNTHHLEEYEIFADHLKDAGKTESARYVREMVDLSAKVNDCLKKAVQALD